MSDDPLDERDLVALAEAPAAPARPDADSPVYDAFRDARTVDTLDCESLSRGRVHRLALQLVQDGLGRDTRLPVLVARGRREGPVVGLTCAVHGNELNGIKVVHRLFRDLRPEQIRGTIVAVLVVNVPAFLARRRTFPEGFDLNHIMPGRPHGHVGQVYAHRFSDRVLSRLDVLFDLHTASTGRVNSLYIRADMTHPRTARLAYLLRPQIVLHNPPSDGTVRGSAMARGIPAVTVEIGNPSRFQERYTKKVLTGLKRSLADIGVLAKRGEPAEGPEPLLCESSAWMYTDRGGLLEVRPDLTDRVIEGEVLARLTSIYGDVLEDVRAPHDGVVIGHSVDPVAETGARIVHLGRLTDDRSHFLRRTAVTREVWSR